MVKITQYSAQKEYNWTPNRRGYLQGNIAWPPLERASFGQQAILGTMMPLAAQKLNITPIIFHFNSRLSGTVASYFLKMRLDFLVRLLLVRLLKVMEPLINSGLEHEIQK